MARVACIIYVAINHLFVTIPFVLFDYHYIEALFEDVVERYYKIGRASCRERV